ncbi:uncharacterized protein LOC113556656 [Rhopalosiphum maidis]|uniref:uncharacterized protein LOC113556656 n=1 Tax=Rhopalosiphum maidis TaxID=43146 RepID=UPI000F003DF0|nr:uncharacterized protein LOC113556656 [Rhopalosiphum maidis]
MADRPTDDATWSSRMDYLSTVVFPRAAADGAFGQGAVYASFRADDRDGAAAAGDQFMSDIVFGTVKLTGAERPADGVPVVVKFKNADARMSAMMNMHQKFYNEYAFYARLLPKLAACAADPAAAFALFPRFLYSNATADGDAAGGQQQVIVLASLAPAGFRAADERVFLDAEHILLAIRKLGALHGLSYNAKADGRGAGPPPFADLCTATLIETQWYDGHWYKSPRFLSGTGNRGVKALRDSDTRGEYEAPLGRMQDMLSGESATMAGLLRPVEPLAVLCHGDFCRNNLLYRYDSATGRPVDVVLLDPAQARYASPAIDLSFFLYMNTTDADRAAHWDRYVAAYLDGVADVTPDGRPAPLTTDVVHAEMRAHGLYGYAHCSFFLPAMVNAVPPDVERLTTSTPDERIELINESGGREADRLLSSIVRHMADRGYV